ncbi:LanC-like protein [Phenylobacterium sp.]|uniref:lanthionine synthetase C family protein n=1 Tax=Phenylobacterium sp. TaxID=1871053 RepID=UPI0030F3AE36
MTDLYPPGRHETLRTIPWDVDAARAAIETIVADSFDAVNARGMWPVHPKDGETGSPSRADLYMGAAGVIWALDHLAREGAVAAGPSLCDHLAPMRERAHAYLVATGRQPRSYLIADAGLLLAELRLAPSPALADTLAEVIAANNEDPTLELMWGSPGTMLAALAMHRMTGEARWGDLFRAGAAALERAFLFQPEISAQIWTQDLYGAQRQHFGLVHGFAGVAFVLIQGRDLLPSADWARWSPRLAQTLAASATRGEAGITWTAGIGPARPGRIAPVQLCHGAPGMIVGLAALDQPVDELLLGGGELTWAAGPLLKGAGVCHGTAGNGYAFLKLFARTGDQLWLDRARAFAMHAIGQSGADFADTGQRRYTLWTGDLGLAAFLWDCLEGKAAFPTLHF